MNVPLFDHTSHRRFAVVVALFLTTLPAQLGYGQVAQTGAVKTPTFRNVQVGGGGAVIGLAADPHVSGLFYMRMDVGGANRWDPANARWVPITESFVNDDFGIDSLVIDPSTARTVYVQTGKYPYGKSHIYKSTNAGDSWTSLPTPPGLKANSNGPDRVVGERLGVDPNNPNVLFLASRNIGLWKTGDDCKTWTQQTIAPGGTVFPLGNSGKNVGLSFVAFDKGGGLTSGASSTIYVGVNDPGADKTDGGVWKTTDGGANWAKMTGGVSSPARGTVASDGTFYVTFLGKTSGAVWKAARADTALTDVSPAPATAYCALAVNPTNPQEVIVSRNAPSYGLNTWRSVDGGKTWAVTGRVHGAGNVVTRDNTGWFGNISQVVMNPFNPGEVWMGDWIGILRTPNVADPKVPWDYVFAGHEEIVPLQLVCAPSGAPLLSADADINGVRHANIDAIPPKGFTTSSKPASYGSTTNMDFCEADPNVWARVLDVFTATATGYVSLDDGENWKAFGSIPSGAKGGRIAVSATDAKNFVWIPEDGEVYATTDQGATWTKAKGAPNVTSAEFGQDSQALASDRVAAGTFYLFKDTKGSPNGVGQIFRSTDGGANWSAVGKCPYSGNHANAFQYKVVAAPGVKNEVWVCIGYNGTYKSTDGGMTFNAVPGVSSVARIAFGKAAHGHTNPALFVMGTAGGLNGILRSDDDGATWKKIDDPAHPVNDAPRIIGGDRQTFGRVYIAGDGRGIYVGDSN